MKNYWLKTKFQRELMDYFRGRIYKNLRELMDDFAMKTDTKHLMPVAHHNRHGIWVADVVDVPYEK